MEIPLADKLAQFVSSQTQVAQDGDIWKAVPGGACANLYLPNQKGVSETGMVEGGVYRTLEGNASTGEWLKIFVHADERVEIAPRSGIVLMATRFDCAVITPGYSKLAPEKYPKLPKVALEFQETQAQQATGKDWVLYDFWQTRAVLPVPGEELLEYRTHVNRGQVQGFQNIEPLAYCRSVLAEMLALKDDGQSATRRWLPLDEIEKLRKRRVAFKRGDLVLVRLSKWTTYVVISDDALFAIDQRWLIALQAHPYRDGDENEPTLFPISSRALGQDGPEFLLSVDLMLMHSVRATQGAVVWYTSKFEEGVPIPASERTAIPADVFKKVHICLKVLYGETST